MTLQDKTLADSHERRGFLNGGLRVDGSESAAIYGVADGVRIRSDKHLALYQERENGPWRLNPGWVEGLEITGTGVMESLPPSGEFRVKVKVQYEFAAYPSGSKYKTGRWLIEEASLVVLQSGDPYPGDVITTPSSGDPEGFYPATTYPLIHSFDSEGVPYAPNGPSPIQVGNNLSIS